MDTFTYVIEEMMDNSVTSEDFELILDQLLDLKVDDRGGMILSHTLEIISSEQRFLTRCAQKGIACKENVGQTYTDIRMMLVFNKVALMTFLDTEVDKDEDDRGIELAVFDSSLMNIGDEMAAIITKYE